MVLKPFIILFSLAFSLIMLIWHTLVCFKEHQINMELSKFIFRTWFVLFSILSFFIFKSSNFISYCDGDGLDNRGLIAMAVTAILTIVYRIGISRPPRVQQDLPATNGGNYYVPATRQIGPELNIPDTPINRSGILNHDQSLTAPFLYPGNLTRLDLDHANYAQQLAYSLAINRIHGPNSLITGVVRNSASAAGYLFLLFVPIQNRRADLVGTFQNHADLIPVETTFTALPDLVHTAFHFVALVGSARLNNSFFRFSPELYTGIVDASGLNQNRNNDRLLQLLYTAWANRDRISQITQQVFNLTQDAVEIDPAAAENTPVADGTPIIANAVIVDQDNISRSSSEAGVKVCPSKNSRKDG